MNTNTNNSGQGPVTVDKPQNGELFDRVAFILDQARANVVRSVNNQMVIGLLADRARDREGGSRW